jgi:uncharacterized membrane protein
MINPNEIVHDQNDIIDNDVSHKLFDLGIKVKLIDGILEILGSFMLMYFNPARLDKLLVFLTQHELSNDPNDVFSNFLVHFGSTFSTSSQHFGMMYLFLHGSIKIIVYLLLLQGTKKAYGFVIGTLALFVIYQSYRFVLDHSIFLLILTVFDIIMIFLAIKEYRNVLKEEVKQS